jgi:hypothetical protein
LYIRTTRKAGGLTCRMLTELVEDLVHLEDGGQGLNQNGGLDAATWHAQGILSTLKNGIPHGSLSAVLHLGEVEAASKKTTSSIECMCYND